jgi:hypothetical protein
VFWAKCARARKAHAIQRIEDAGDTADDCTEENAQSAKVKIGYATWLAERLLSKEGYGNKQELEVKGDPLAELLSEFRSQYQAMPKTEAPDGDT